MSSASSSDHPVMHPVASQTGVGAVHIPVSSYDLLITATSKKLLDRRESLFSKEHDEAECWIAGSDDGESLSKTTGSESSSHRQIQELASESYEIYNYQKTGLGKMPHSPTQVTSETFDRLVNTLRPFTFFLGTVLNFGIKVKDDNNTWHGFHSRHHLTDVGSVETCYMLHFFENNGRTTGDPWSPRQTAVYHHYHASSDRSSWILIKPSAHLEEPLQIELENASRLTLSAKSRATRLHVMFTSFALSNWPNYIATQTTKVEEFEAKSFFSEVDHIQLDDYDLRFQDRQNLQRLKQRLLRAAAMLDATINLQERVRGLLEKNGDDALKDAMTVEMNDFDAEAKYYCRCISDLQQRASDTLSLLLDILNRRYGHANLRSAAANEASLKANVASLSTMTSIAVSGEMEHKLEQKTAVNVRALTVVATLYLPASLLSSIFSSHLVDVNSAGIFYVPSEFWKFVVVLVPMTLITFVVVAILQAVWTAKERKVLRKMVADASAKNAAVASP
ncbi:hypothetical protein NPX13_g3649 [Xylaria arbuscula]|uniref:CorA-like transporter domain-containing protein n=1 Tax=Xylaria arbuscula TaxID=114810 RepID=A0A9W8NGY1_9PEZI|nr:hypothetical protein NPX13_g3649 [Xylaria arbuscula]